MMLGIAALAVAGAVCAQDPPPAKAPAKKTGGNSAAAARGKDLFEKKCGICHYADSDAKKIGPGRELRRPKIKEPRLRGLSATQPRAKLN